MIVLDVDVCEGHTSVCRCPAHKLGHTPTHKLETWGVWVVSRTGHDVWCVPTSPPTGKGLLLAQILPTVLCVTFTHVECRSVIRHLFFLRVSTTTN